MATNTIRHVAVAALVLGAAACSDDDSSNESAVTTDAPTDTSGATVPDTSPPTTTPPTTSPATTEATTDTTEAEMAPETTAAASTSVPADALMLGVAGSWTPDDLDGLETDESNSIPLIDNSLADERVFGEYWAWDWWPVRTETGEVAEIDGWQVAIALSAPADVLPGKRHDIATHRYAISDDGGETWTLVGEVFPEGEALGSRQWAGSAMYDESTRTLYAFYTAAGEAGEPVDEAVRSDEPNEGKIGPSGGAINADISYRQQLAMASATVEVDDDGMRFVDWSDHTILFNGQDSEYYAATQDTEGGAGNIAAFRDPWYYLDEDTGDEYVLFTATMPEAECEGNGLVGIARATSDDLTSYEILPPLLDGHCVNNELERPHIIEENDLTYLLFTTHAHTFRDGVEGPEGYYGFVADELMGDYEPLNDTGLVLANPSEDPYQAYSWMALPGGVVTGFFQYFDLAEGEDLDYVGTRDPEYQFDHFAGTFAPSIHIEFDGADTEFVEVLGAGVVLSSDDTMSDDATADDSSSDDE